MRKGQSMSISVIIAAVIALLVLVVLALIFMDKIRGVNQDIGACETKGGQCVSAFEGCPQGTSELPAVCPTESVCCLNIGN